MRIAKSWIEKINMILLCFNYMESWCREFFGLKHSLKVVQIEETNHMAFSVCNMTDILETQALTSMSAFSAPMALFLSAVHMCLSVQNTFCPRLTRHGLYSYIIVLKIRRKAWDGVCVFPTGEIECFCGTDVIMCTSNCENLFRKFWVCHLVPASSRHALKFKW